MTNEKTDLELMEELYQKETLERLKTLIIQLKAFPQTTATDLNMLRTVYNRLKGKIDPDF